MLSKRENTLRTIRFEGPEWIPCKVGLSSGIWNRHREALEDVVMEHPSIFGHYERGQRDFDEFPDAHRAGEESKDPWGSIWHNVSSGICGQPKVHPLEDWGMLSTFKAPEPFEDADFDKLREEAEEKQIANLARVRQERDDAEVDSCLKRLKEAAGDESVNLMPAILEAVKAYASVGEMCGVLREVFGEYEGYKIDMAV